MISLVTLAATLSALSLLARRLVSQLVRADSQSSRSILKYYTGALHHTIGPFLRRPVAARYSLRAYALNRLETKGQLLPIPGHALPLQTDDAYIPLLMSDGDRTIDHGLLLAARSDLLILGEPGSGKSSLTKRCFRDLCRRAIVQPNVAGLPIHIELRNLDYQLLAGCSIDHERRDWLIAAVRTEVESVAAYDMSEMLDLYTEGPGTILFLDGLDEVPLHQVDSVLQAIAAYRRHMAAQKHTNRIVVTARTQLYRQLSDWARDQLPAPLVIAPFRPSDVYEFLRRWPYADTATARETRAVLFQRINELPSLRSMCRNPLILSMYVASSLANGNASFGDTRSAFYRDVLDELLVRRRARQQRTVAVHAVRATRRAIFGTLALNHIENLDQALNSLPWHEAVATVQEVLGEESFPAAEQILRTLAVDTGLIEEEVQGEQIRFTHLTFCEYLAAVELADQGLERWQQCLRRGGNTDINATTHLSRLAEVLIFTVPLLSRDAQSTAIESLESVADPALLSRAYLETQLYDRETFPAFIEGQLTTLRGQRPPGGFISEGERATDRLTVADLLSLDLVPRIQDRTDAAGADDETGSWIDMLHVMLALVRDAARVGLETGRPSPTLSAVAALDHVMEETGLTGRILESYLDVDPQLALDHLEQSARLTAPNVLESVIGASDSPHILEEILARAQAKTGMVRGVYCGIALQSALLYRNVFDELSSTQAAPEWREQLGSIDDRFRWDRARRESGTVLSVLAAVAFEYGRRDSMDPGRPRIRPDLSTANLVSWNALVTTLGNLMPTLARRPLSTAGLMDAYRHMGRDVASSFLAAARTAETDFVRTLGVGAWPPLLASLMWLPARGGNRSAYGGWHAALILTIRLLSLGSSRRRTIDELLFLASRANRQVLYVADPVVRSMTYVFGRNLMHRSLLLRGARRRGKWDWAYTTVERTRAEQIVRRQERRYRTVPLRARTTFELEQGEPSRLFVRTGRVRVTWWFRSVRGSADLEMKGPFFEVIRRTDGWSGRVFRAVSYGIRVTVESIGRAWRFLYVGGWLAVSPRFGRAIYRSVCDRNLYSGQRSIQGSDLDERYEFSSLPTRQWPAPPPPESVS